MSELSRTEFLGLKRRFEVPWSKCNALKKVYKLADILYFRLNPTKVRNLPHSHLRY